MTARYARLLAERGYTADDAQRGAVERLQRLQDELAAFRQARANRLRRLVAPPKPPRGVWLWGGVPNGAVCAGDGPRRRRPMRLNSGMRGAARTIENPSTWAQAGLKHRPYPCQREGFVAP